MRSIWILISVLLFLTPQRIFAQQTATVKGTIADYYRFKDKKNSVKITVTDPERVTHTLIPDDQGNFELTFLKLFKQDIQIQFNEYTPIKTLIAPDQYQTYILNPIKYDLHLIDCIGDGAATVKIMGDYFASIKKYRDGNDFRYSTPYIKPSLGSLMASQAILENYINNHKVNEDFVQWARADIKNEYAYYTVYNQSNQHSSVTDSFFVDFPLDDTNSLISSNYLRMLNYRAFDISFNNNYVTTTYAGVKSIQQYAEIIQKFQPEYAEKLEDYPVDKSDRVKVKYIVKNSTGKVRDIWLANLITASYKKKDKSIRFQERLMRDYKEFVPNGIYSKRLEQQLAIISDVR